MPKLKVWLMVIGSIVLSYLIFREFSWFQQTKVLESGRHELRDVLSEVYSIAIEPSPSLYVLSESQGRDVPTATASSKSTMDTAYLNSNTVPLKGMGTDKDEDKDSMHIDECKDQVVTKPEAETVTVTGTESHSQADLALSIATAKLTKITALIQTLPYIMEHVHHGFRNSARLFVFKGVWDWVIMACMVIMMQCEVVYSHTQQPCDPKKEHIHNKHIARHLQLYYSRHLPVSSLLFYSCIFILSCLSWLGNWVFIDRENLTRRLLRIILFWSFSSYISLVCGNVRMLIPYMPTIQNTTDILDKFKSRQWWLWFLPRCLLFGPGLDNLSLMYGAIWFLLWLLHIWPIRYFYVNTDAACSDYANSRYTDIFISRMLLHFAFLKVWYHFTTLNVIGLPTFLRVPYEISINASTIGAIANSVLCLLSVLWWAFFGSNCGWWASVVSLGFLNPFIIVVISSVLFVTAQVHRESEKWLHLRTYFVENYTNILLPHYCRYRYRCIDTDNNNNNATESSTESQLEIARELDDQAGFLFDQLLHGASRVYIWLPHENIDDENATTSPATANINGETSNTEKGSTIMFENAFVDSVKVLIRERQSASTIYT